MELFNVYSLYPVEPVRGKSCFVYDAAGTEYLDLYGGHAVISIGHAQPDYVRALGAAARLGFYSNSVENSLQTTLAEKLAAHRATTITASSSAIRERRRTRTPETGFVPHRPHEGAGLFQGVPRRTSAAVAATDNPAISAPFNRTANVESYR